jgi:hypothetical protein
LAEAIALQDAAIEDINAKLETIGDDFDENQIVEVTEYDIFGAATTKKVKKANPKTVLQANLKIAQAEKKRLENDDRFGLIIRKIRKLVSWDPFEQNISSLFFEPEWMFGVAEGFDVILGNPPYIQLEAEKGKLSKLYAPCGYETFDTKGNIYCLFFEKGWQLLRQNGTLSFITLNKWMRADYGRPLRRFLTSKTNPTILVDFGGIQVFESANVDTDILLFHKAPYEQRTQSSGLKLKDVANFSSLYQFVKDNHIICHYEDDDTWVIMTDEKRAFKKQIEAKGKPLVDWDIQINRGILTGYNPAFIISSETRDYIISNCHDGYEISRTRELIRPILRGKDIRKYSNNWTNTKLYIINTHNGIRGDIERIDVNDYQAVKSFLANFIVKLTSRSDKGDTPYNLRNCAYLRDFDKPKIIYPNMTKYLPFYFDEQKFLTNQKCFILTGKHLSYLTALFNSSLFKYCFIDDFPPLGEDRRELSKIYFERMPILEVDDATNEIFRGLVLDIQKEYSDDKAKAIDQRIFDLYGLTQEERDKIGYIDFHSAGVDDDEEDDEDD